MTRLETSQLLSRFQLQLKIGLSGKMNPWQAVHLRIFGWVKDILGWISRIYGWVKDISEWISRINDIYGWIIDESLGSSASSYLWMGQRYPWMDI